MSIAERRTGRALLGRAAVLGLVAAVAIACGKFGADGAPSESPDADDASAAGSPGDHDGAPSGGDASLADASPPAADASPHGDGAGGPLEAGADAGETFACGTFPCAAVVVSAVPDVAALVARGDTFAFVSGNTVYIGHDGAPPDPVFTSTNALDPWLALDPPNVYATHGGDTDGVLSTTHAVTSIFHNRGGPLAFANGALFVFDQSGGKLYECKDLAAGCATAGEVQLGTHIGNADALTAAGGWVFAVFNDAIAVSDGATSGGNTLPSFSAISAVTGLAADASRVYWSTSGSIQSTAAPYGSTSLPVAAVNGLIEAHDVAIDGQRLYWIDKANGDATVKTCLLGACGAPDVLAIVQKPRLIAVTDHRVYFASDKGSLYAVDK